MKKHSGEGVLNKNSDKYKYKTIVGYLLMIVGIAIPLFAFTSLSINQIETSSRYEEYVKKSKNTSYDKNYEEGIKNYNNKINKSDTNIIDPFIVEGYKTKYDFLKNDTDKVFAYLVIPTIKVAKPIRLDATFEHLEKGVAQVDGTSLPVGGLGSRSVIAGHRGWYGDVMFFNLDKLKNGDKVYVDREGEILTYIVKNREIISPSEWEKLKPIENKDMLTLLSCHPKVPPSPYRLLINCERLNYESNNNYVMSINKSNNKKIKNDLEKNDNSVKWTNFVIYFITILGWIALIFIGYKFIKNCFKKQSYKIK